MMPEFAPSLPLLICVLFLILFGVGFNFLTKKSQEKRVVPVSVLVVIGVFVTLTVPTIMFLNVELFAWQASLIYACCFMASGIPMIWGNIHRHTKRKHRERRLGRHASQVRDDVVMDLTLMIKKIMEKEADIVDVVHTLHQVIGSLKSL